MVMDVIGTKYMIFQVARFLEAVCQKIIAATVRVLRLHWIHRPQRQGALLHLIGIQLCPSQPTLLQLLGLHLHSFRPILLLLQHQEFHLSSMVTIHQLGQTTWIIFTSQQIPP